jgi:hypothetical protein
VCCLVHSAHHVRLTTAKVHASRLLHIRPLTQHNTKHAIQSLSRYRTFCAAQVDGALENRLSAEASDDAKAKKLWEVSCQLVGLADKA